jgi:flagellar basal-body rod protein FlgG
LKDRILEINASALKSNEAEYELMITNLVNSRTPGFKESHFSLSTFSEVLSQAEKKARGEKVEAINLHTNFSQGSLIQTNLPLDFAITGEGFFVFQSPQGLVFTRDGRFQVNSSGELVSLSKGFPVLGEGGAIVILDPKDVTVSTEGEIFVGDRRIEKLKIVSFQKNEDLKSIGGSFFQLNNLDVQVKDNFTYQIKHGFIELSNVDTMQSMIDMIVLSRFEGVNAKAVTARDTMLSRAMELGAPPK